MKNIYKIAEKILAKTDCPANIIVSKNTWNLCKSIEKKYKEKFSKCDWTANGLYSHYYNIVRNKPDYLDNRADFYFTYREPRQNRMNIHGACGKDINTIFFSKELKFQSKKYIKYVILHEIGHWFNGESEADADKFAMKWLYKV